MCTVTYLPTPNGFLLTSSRDEKVIRPTLKPKTYIHNSCKLIYPKDEIANGSWIAASNKKTMACLLNGGFTNHIKKNNYTKSRGQVLIDCLEIQNFEDAILDIDLKNVEPFTLLFINFKDEIVFHQLVWDGSLKHHQIIPRHTPKIWSSSTLYSEKDKIERISWFTNWLNKYKEDEDKNILSFHTTKHSDISSKNVMMKRDDELQTVSVSQIKIDDKNQLFFYFDLSDSSKTYIDLSEITCIQE